MKAGIVVKVRVSPEDVMTAIDLVKASGRLMSGMSLPEVIRLALSGTFHNARESGAAPVRDGFEYNEMVQPFKYGDVHSVHHARRVQVGHILAKAEQQRKGADALPLGAREHSELPPAQPRSAAKQAKLRELSFKRRADPLNFSPEDQALLDALFDEGYRA